MEKDNRPAGRKKIFGSGSGNAAKRGEGLSEKTGGPLGEASGYADRGAESSADQGRGSAGGQMTYRLSDIYNNHYWTPSVSD